MDCHNKEKFDVSTIMFEQRLIKDSEGNFLFNLNNYTNQKQFACDISVNSTLPSSKTNEANNNNKTNPDTNTNNTKTNNNTNNNSTEKEPNKSDEDESMDNTKKYNKNYFKNSSSGLSGGALAAIIICCIIVLAIIGAIIGFSRRAPKAPIDKTDVTNSTLHNLDFQPQKSEF